MTEPSDLIERLNMRLECEMSGAESLRNPDGPEAADHIAALQAENAKLREEAARFAAMSNRDMLAALRLEARVGELEAERDALRAALEDAEDTLRLVERPAFRDPRYGDEVEALGLRIGFGALMSSASASWREHLAADGDPVGGEFVAGPCHGTVVSTLAKIRAARALSGKAPKSEDKP